MASFGIGGLEALRLENPYKDELLARWQPGDILLNAMESLAKVRKLAAALETKSSH